MTENTRGQKWVIISFFMVIGLFFLYFVFFIVRGGPDPAYSRLKTATGTANESIWSGGQIVLPKNAERSIDGLRLTFRGVSGGELRLDVVVVALDRHYAYRHRIAVSDAEKGLLRLPGLPCRVDSVSRNALRLEIEAP
jgi:hypothetical protein